MTLLKKHKTVDRRDYFKNKRKYENEYKSIIRSKLKKK